MDYIFYQVAAVNGFDQYGHYLRAGLIVNLCSTYATAPAPGCSSNFVDSTAASARLNPSQRDQLKASAAALAGNRPVVTGSRTAAATPKSRAKPIGMPKIALPGGLGQILSQGTAAEGTKTAAPKTQVQSPLGAPTASQAPDPRQGLLDYLLGTGS
jgi:hypothetical protein